MLQPNAVADAMSDSHILRDKSDYLASCVGAVSGRGAAFGHLGKPEDWSKSIAQQKLKRSF